MQGLVSHESLQPCFFVAQPPQLLQIAQLHSAILALPSMECRGADVGFPADGRYRLAALGPAQDRYDLLRGMSLSCGHVWGLS